MIIIINIGRNLQDINDKLNKEEPVRIDKFKQNSKKSKAKVCSNL
jgi:transcriptional regulatory protein LevR